MYLYDDRSVLYDNRKTKFWLLWISMQCFLSDLVGGGDYSHPKPVARKRLRFEDEIRNESENSIGVR